MIVSVASCSKLIRQSVRTNSKNWFGRLTSFVFIPVGRREDTTRARAAGNEIRSVIAGYHWFTDWGRDTMISLEGLTLTTGRQVEASYILRTFAHYIKDGLIPNMFPEGKTDGLYHTADATLWFFHAFERYMQRTGDHHLMVQLLPCFLDIVGNHLRGTNFNIHVDPADGLLVQGQEGYQLTWMDAKVDGWVVTPRRGKAVEINALWYNALRLLEKWLHAAGRIEEAEGICQHAAKCQASFNERFWCEERGHLYDVVDTENGGDDPSCRPNQVFSISLDNPVLDQSRWQSVMNVVEAKLLTPVGLRSLASRRARLQSTLRWGPSFARRRLSPGNRLGLAHWTLRRCLAKGPSRRSGNRTRIPGRLPPSHGISLCRLDKRNLRRRGALQPTRLLRPSLERSRSTSLPRENKQPR